MLEFVESGLYFVYNENNFINPLLQQDPDPMKEVPDPAGQKSTDPDPHPRYKVHGTTTIILMLIQICQ